MYRSFSPLSPTRKYSIQRRFAFWGISLLLFGGGCWTVFWYMAKWRAEEILDTWYRRELDSGRLWHCQDYTLKGFPFQISLTCFEPRVDFVFHGQPHQGSFHKLQAQVHLRDPSRLQMHAEGPLILQTSSAPLITFSWRSAYAEIAGKPAAFQQFSLLLEHPKMVYGLDSDTTFQATHAEMNIRQSSDQTLAPHAYDISLHLIEGGSPLLAAFVPPADKLALHAAFTLSQMSPPLHTTFLKEEELEVYLERWRNAGGSLQIHSLEARAGMSMIEIAGRLRLNPQHIPEGNVSVHFQNIDHIIMYLASQPGTSVLSADLTPLLTFFFKNPSSDVTEVADSETSANAASIPHLRHVMLELRDGHIRFDRLPIPFRIPPLY